MASSSKTEFVFVIGAGASFEADLPLGNELTKHVADLFGAPQDPTSNEQYLIYNAISAELNSYNIEQDKIHERRLDLQRKAYAMSRAMPLAESIDNYVHDHRDDEDIAFLAKLAITLCILRSERESRLHFNPYNETIVESYENHDAHKEESTWYLSFFKLLTKNCTAENLKSRFKRIALVVFNYDRSVEHFLYHALKIYYPELHDTVSDVLKSLTILHPYGKVGNLEWEQNSPLASFGHKTSADELLEISKCIRTFTEGMDETDGDIDRVHKHISSTQRLVFLGFSFNTLNMQLLKPPGDSHEPKCYATTYGISKNDEFRVIDLIRRATSNRHIEPYLGGPECGCSQFFNEYWMRLSID